MLDFPAHDAQVVAKSLIDRSAGPCEPRPQCGLVVKARCVRFEAQKLDKIVILANTKLTCGPEGSPHARCESWVSCEIRVGADQILGDPRHKPLRVNIGERRYLFVGQLKHADAL